MEIDLRFGRTNRLVQFGAGGPFVRYVYSTLRAASRAEVVLFHPADALLLLAKESAA